MNNVSFGSLRNSNFHVEGKLINPENDFDKMNVHHSSPTYTVTNTTYQPRHEFGKIGKETLEEKMEFGKLGKEIPKEEMIFGMVDPKESLGRSMVYFSPEALTLDKENSNSSSQIQNKVGFDGNLDEKYSQKEIRKILKQARSPIMLDSVYSIGLIDNGNLVINNKTFSSDTVVICPDGSSYQTANIVAKKLAPEGTCLDIINEAKKRAEDL